MDQTIVASEATTSQPQTNPGQQGDDGKEDSIRKKSNVRKRTKTGCLTCRKRRIKCDEARPTCNNCIKSKRQCEGYNQRVVFKDPMAFHPGPYGPVYQGPHHLVNQLQTKSSSQGPLAMIAPKPPAFGFPGHVHSNMNFAPHHPGQHPSSHPQIPPTPMPVPIPVPIPVPMPVPPISSTYNFNQTPSSHIQFPQSSDLLPPPAQPAYNKVEQSPREHHPFLMRQDGQSSSASLKQESQVISSPIDEEISDIVGPQEQTWDYELPEDEASMGESDDETQDPRMILGPVVKRFNANWDTNGTRVRAFSTFAQCNVLSEYTAHTQIRELKDPRMLAIFMHFIKVTGPSMSLYERHPFDHGDDDHFNPAPKATSSKLWSYTFPLISFNHPGLLHAMLALASLQISKLQMVPPTAAMKHYHLALRRISKNVQAHGRRTQPPTLAATLLLAYFEVWSSDHTKWSTHLFGARILFREIPLREMTRQCLPVKRLKQRQKDLEEQDNTHPYFPNYGAKPRGPLLDLDYQFLSQMCGQHVTPEDYGLGEEQIVELNGSTTDRDVEQYENLRDLYWWYCKMDVYQSMLSGAKLFMEFECWTQCPPRAPISKLEAIYGTYDHLMLLLGRLAAFSSKDRSRKQRASRGRAGPSGSPPIFPGMLPTNGKTQVPTGFGPDVGSSPQSDAQDDPDPEASFNSAMQEWEVVHGAFVAFEKALGPEFQPLRPEFTDRRDSPFGASLQYRTFSVAGVWMNFYMGMIYLYRVRPDMPPVPMQAAGLSARQTAGYAAQVGRIAAGLSDDCSQVTEISTMVSAAFIESCFCLFVAGVQYQDDAQRHWLIRRMHDISRLTGWQSAKQIADGCESGWIKAAQLGRGPPYVRSASIGVDVPISVWRNPRRIDRVIQEELDNGIEQRLVLAKSEQAYYALGLLGVEQDLEVLELKDDG